MSLVQLVFLAVSKMLLSLGPLVPGGTMISVVKTQASQLEKLVNYELRTCCFFGLFWGTHT